MLLTALIITDRQLFSRLCESSFHARNIYVKSLSGSGAPLEGIQIDILLVDALTGEEALGEIDSILQGFVEPKPAVFVCLKERSPNWEWTFARKGVMYVFDRNMQESMLVDCIMSIYNMHHAVPDKEGKVTPELVRILRQCYISPRHRGYACIFKCVKLMYLRNDPDQLLTKEIYPQIAKKQRTTPMRVEKNIRDAIRGGWERGGKEVMPYLLGCGRDKPPTNGEFILCLCEKMLENLYEDDRYDRVSLPI